MKLVMKPTNVIKANLGLEPSGPVQAFFTAECAKTMDKYVPINQGNLASYYILDNNKIIYDQPYAHYMYEGLVMGPNIPIIEEGLVVGWFSPKGKPKYYTGEEIDYSNSVANGHEFAGPHWDERMWSAEKTDIIKKVQEYFNKHGGK